MSRITPNRDCLMRNLGRRDTPASRPTGAYAGIGGVPQLAEKIPIRNFVDHGPSSEKGQDEDMLFNVGAHLLL